MVLVQRDCGLIHTIAAMSEHSLTKQTIAATPRPQRPAITILTVPYLTYPVKGFRLVPAKGLIILVLITIPVDLPRKLMSWKLKSRSQLNEVRDHNHFRPHLSTITTISRIKSQRQPSTTHRRRCSTRIKEVNYKKPYPL